VLLISGAFSFYISMWLIVPLLPAYVLDLHGSEADIGLVLGVFALTALLARPLAGRLVDTHGCKVVALAGCLVYAIAPFLYIVSTSVPILIIVRMFHGLGISFFGTAGTTWVANMVPPARRAEAMGLYSNASQVGVAIAPLLGALIHDAGGYTVLFVVAALIAFAGIAFISPAQESRHAGAGSARAGSFRQALGRRDVMTMTFTLMTAAATWGLLTGFLPVYVIQRNAGQSAVFFTVYAVATVFLRLVIGPISDRLGRRVIIGPALLGMAVIMLLFTQMYSALTLYVLAALYALSFGIVYPTLSAFLVDVVPGNVRGSAIGVFTAGFDMGVMVGSTLGGMVAEVLGLEATFVAIGLLCLVGVVVFWTGTREPPKLPIPIMDGESQ
jgi:MFS family permease